MTCKRTELGPVMVWTCGRREPAPERCPNCGRERTAAATCEFPLSGAKTGQSCARPLCLACAVRVDSSVLCPAHDRVVRARARMR